MNPKDIKKKPTIDPNDSECEDDESEIFKNQARKASEKQQEIDELSKRLRYVELEFKKKEIEINAELANERTRANELQEILTNQLSGLKENREAHDLQERLVLVENDLFEKQQIAHEMLHQLTQIEMENDQLKAEVERYRQAHPSLLSENASPSRRNDENIDVDKLVSRCLELEKEKQELAVEVEQIRRGAIDAIVEKEKMILDLQEALEHSLSMQSADVIPAQNATSGQLLTDGVEQLRQEYEAEVKVLTQRCEELQQHLEQEQLFHQEQLHTLDASISQRVFENLQSHIDSAKNTEADLLSQLSMLDERLKTQDRLLGDSSKLLAQTREELKREKEIAEAKIQRLSKQCESFDELQKTCRAISKELEELKKASEKDISDKQHQIDKLTLKRDEQLKNAVNLESDNKRLRENITQSKLTISQLENTVEDLYSQIDEAQKDNQIELKAAVDRLEAEKAAIYDEILRVKSVKVAAEFVQSNQDHHDQNDGNSDAQVFAAIVAPTIIVEDSSNCNSSNTVIAGKQSKPPVSPQQTESTLLGLEFNDEDFSIEDEEEKTDSFSMISSGGGGVGNNTRGFSSSSASRQQKSPTVTINPFTISGGANGLSGSGSTRNQFKKQFMLITPDRVVAEGTSSAAVNDHFVAELKAKISKLERSVASYEATIEKLQTESKQILKQLQDARREKVLSNREAELIEELNSFKTHCHRIETQFVTQKLQLTEDLHFLKDELKIYERQNNEFRKEIANQTSEKNYYQVKYAKLKGILKHRRTGGSLGGDAFSAQSQKPSQQINANSPNSSMIKSQYEKTTSTAAATVASSSSSSSTSSHAKKKSFWIFK